MYVINDRIDIDLEKLILTESSYIHHMIIRRKIKYKLLFNSRIPLDGTLMEFIDNK